MSNFIVFLLLLLAIAALLRIDFFFTILYLFVVVYVLSALWARRMLKQVEFRRRLQQRAFSGDNITVTLEFKNKGVLPIPWLMLTESVPAELAAPPLREVVALGSKASHTSRYTLSARKRGYYRIGPLLVRTGDILGVRKELLGRFEADYLIVYPRVIPITKLGLPTHSPQVVLPTSIPIFPDPSRMSGVRDYIPGDNPRHIHWPATAATGQVLVKQFQPAIARESVIFINLDRSDYAKRGYPDSAIELAIIVAASLANHISAFENLPVGLITTAFDPLIEKQQQFRLPPQKGRNQLMQILEVLARVQDMDNTHFLEQIRREAVHLSWGATVIIITSHATEALQETILFLKRSGFRVTPVLVDPPRSHVRERAESLHISDVPIFKITREKDIEVWAPSL